MEIYDFMAAIIRHLLNRKFKFDKVGAVAADSRKDIEERIEKLLEENSFSLTDPESFLDVYAGSPIFLTFFLQKLDEIAADYLEDELWKKKINFEPFQCMDSLNSQDNKKKTNIIMLPRYECIWEGKSRERNHLTDVNTFLRHSFCVETKSGKVEGKYTIKNYILNPKYFALCMNEQNELFLPISVSPLTDDVALKDTRYQQRKKGENINYFMVEEPDEKVQNQLIAYIEKVMRKSDRNGDKILVFPEMLGTEKMKQAVIEQIEKENFENLHFLIFPSIWEKKGKHRNHNTAYVIDREGNEWFGQDKLKRFPWGVGGETFLEDIVEGTELHIIHCAGYGSVAVAICRSELDQNVRTLLMQRLNVKLILCPSWTPGHHEFEYSIMTGIERTCNVAWCNSCSAVDVSKQEKKTVGIITSFGKNRQFSKPSLDGCRFPDGDCESECQNGCLFSGKVYGTEYKENQLEEGENNGWENGFIDAEWRETSDI